MKRRFTIFQVPNSMYEQDLLEYKGEVANVHYEQIINGLLESPNITDDIKELIRRK